MKIVRYSSDRVVDSTDNNEYAEGYRDETLVDEDGWDTEVATDDAIPDGVNELEEGDRPIYNEEGYGEEIS